MDLVLSLLLDVSGVNAHLLVVLLQRSEILTSLRELAFLHTSPTYQWTKARLEYMRSNL